MGRRVNRGPGRSAAGAGLIAIPLWVAVGGIAIFADVLLLRSLSQIPDPPGDTLGLISALGWLVFVMTIPCAWLMAAVLLGCRVAHRSPRTAIPFLAWAGFVPIWMLLARTVGVQLGPLPLIVLLAVPAAPGITAMLLWLHTGGRAVPIACIGACIPSVATLHFLDVESGLASAAAPMVWTLIVTYFIFRAAAQRALRPGAPGKASPCPSCGYMGPSSLGAPCPRCASFSP